MRVEENINIGTSIANLRAVDPDEGQNGVVRYRLAGPSSPVNVDPQRPGSTSVSVGDRSLPFAVDPKTGEVTVVGRVDFEQRRVHELTVVAEDYGSDPLPSFAKLTVYVTDLNDNRPRITINTLSSSSSSSQQPHHYNDDEDGRRIQQLNYSPKSNGSGSENVGGDDDDDDDDVVKYAVIAENSPKGEFDLTIIKHAAFKLIGLSMYRNKIEQ